MGWIYRHITFHHVLFQTSLCQHRPTSCVCHFPHHTTGIRGRHDSWRKLSVTAEGKLRQQKEQNYVQERRKKYEQRESVERRGLMDMGGYSKTRTPEGSEDSKRKEMTQQNGDKRRNKTLRWLASLHKDLMRGVKLPPIKRGMPLMYKEELLHAMSISELMSEARAIQHVDESNMKFIQALWHQMDAMTVEEIITTADIFFLNGLSVPWYSSAVISYMTEMFDLLPFSPELITRMCIHVANHRHSTPYLLMAMEEHLSKNFDQYEFHQVCLVCHTFFLIRYKMKSVDLLDKIANRLLSEFGSVKHWSVPVLMKSFRFSQYMKVSFYKQLGDLIVQQKFFSETKSLGEVMHVALTYASLHISHDELFVYILQEFLQAEKSRLKDITKLLWAFGTLVGNWDDHAQTLNRLIAHRSFSNETVLEYPDNLVEGLMGLAYINIYPPTLLNKLFDPEVLRILTSLGGNRSKAMQLEFLDNSVAIECPSYSGHRLSMEDRKSISVSQNMTAHFNVEVDLQLRRSVKPTLAALQSVFGEEMVAYHNVLPHFRIADIVLVWDKNKQQFLQDPKKYDVDFRNSPEGSRLLQRIVIILTSKPQYSFDGRPLGPLHCKLRQLNRLGYHTIVVASNEAREYCLMTEESIQRALLPRLSHVVGVDLKEGRDH